MKIAVYGTLRKDEHNYRYYMSDIEPLGTEVIAGFEMYDLGSYPYVVKHFPTVDEAEEHPAIAVEVYDLTPDIVNRIADMEQGAGYEVMVVPTQFGDALLFYVDIYEHERRERQAKESGYRIRLIPDGDWLKRTTSAERSVR